MFLLALFAFYACRPLSAGNAGDLPDWYVKYKNSPEMKKAIEKWRDIGFEIFVHWSAGTAFQGRYHGKELQRDLWGEWLMKRAGIPIKEYEAVLKTWNPKDFNAKEWADILAASGAKMVVYIAKHHDGFAHFKSGANDFNTHDWGAFHTDVFGELCAELRERGILTGFYYSHGKDWRNFPDGKDRGEKMRKYFESVVYPHLRELNQNYGHQTVCWFDLGAPTRETALECVKVLRETNPTIVISSRVGFHLGDFSTGGDAYIPPVPKEEPWETCMTFNHHWAWYPEDRDEKTPAEIIRMLAKIRSRGGNLLLNIGPDARGKIPLQEKFCLEKVGKWLAKNGDSIYGVRASGFADLPWGVCTLKPGKLFLHVLHLPTLDYIYLPGVDAKVTGAYLLADKNKTPLKIEKDAFGGRKIYLYDANPDAIDYTDTVVALAYEGKLRVDRTPVLDNDLPNTFLPQLATASGGAKCASTRLTPCIDHAGVQEPRYYQYAAGFDKTAAKLEWTFNCVAANEFYLNIDYANLTGETLKCAVTVNGKNVTVDLPPTCPLGGNICAEPFKLVFSKPLLIEKGSKHRLVFALDAASVGILGKAAEKTSGKGKRRKRGINGKFLLRSVILKSAYPLPYRGYGGNPDTTKLAE